METKGNSDMGEIRIGLLGVEHAAELQRVAERDSSTVPTGMVLGAQVNGRLVAAHSVIDGTAVADPFVPTAELQALLSQRVKQIRGGHHSGLLRKLGRNGRRSRSRGSVPASPPGGGFRVPDVMKQSGARLIEVGATNKVRLSDYSEALEEPAALVMHAHRSNFKIVGFTEEPELRTIVEAAHKSNVPVVDDLGSGALLDTAKYGLAHEPTVQESLAAGVDLVCFSGDKLLGGPQAGIILGKKELMDKLKKHPLARAVRADKTCLAALNATLLHYLKDEAERKIPIWGMIALTPDRLKVRAEAWREELGLGDVIQSESTVGGGSLPEESLPTFVLALKVKSPDKFLRKLREENPPIIARTENDKVLLDPRTVLPEQEELLLRSLKKELYEI